MKAMLVEGPGGVEQLRVGEVPVPRPGQGELLIAVKGIGINRADLEQRQGEYEPPPGASPLLGLEVAGTVAERGEGAEAFSPGDRVMALLPGGGYAQYAIARAELTFPIPARLDFLQAAAVPEAFFTVWLNVFERARLRPGETLLVHGGSSGVGSTAIQLARQRGATVLATARTNEKCAACVRLGAARAINYSREDFVEAVLQATAGRGADVILDVVGGAYLPRNVLALAEGGRLSMIDCQAGALAQLDMARLVTRSLTVCGSVLRPLPLAEKTRIAERIREELLPLLEHGHVTPLISHVFPLERVREAHLLVEQSLHIGKVVVTPEPQA